MGRGGLFRRRNKKLGQQAPEASSRNVQKFRGGQPTFSYYSNRLPSDMPRLRSEQTVAAYELANSDADDTPGLFSRIVTVLGLILFGFVLVKIVSLQPDARIILSSKATTGSVTSDELGRYQRTANELLAGSVLNKSKLTINTGAIERSMQKQFPELESVVVAVPLVGARPIVYVLPVPSMVSIETTRGAFSLGTNGRVIAKLSEGQQKGLIVRDLSGVQPEVGQALLPSSTMQFIQIVQHQFQRANMPVESMTLPSSASFELDAKLAGKGGVIKFNLEEDAMQQSGAALGVIRKLSNMPGQYLDVRVPERAYYK